MYTFRRLSGSDIDVVCRHRELMFREGGRYSDALLGEMTTAFRAWLAPRITDGRYFGEAVEDRVGTVVAGVGLMLLDWPPHPLHSTQPVRGYVLNLYVEPQHRGHGLGRQLMEHANGEFRRRGVTYRILHPTQMAAPMYEKFGWRRTNEMAYSEGDIKQ